MGSKIHLLNLKEINFLIAKWIEAFQSGKGTKQIIVTGFHGISESHRDNALWDVLNSADLWVPDGIAPVWIAKMKGHSKVVRTPGAEIMKTYFEMANEKGYSSFFYGDTNKTLDNLCYTIMEKYPDHRIAGAYSPPFRRLTMDEDKEVIEMINNAQPDVLWVALGMPKQERWIYERKRLLKVPVAVGVGAAFAFISGDVKRVPPRIGRLGLEWLWRFFQEPQKLWKRDLIDGPKFLWNVFLELIGYHKYD